jgi:carboxypeptidase Taq
MNKLKEYFKSYYVLNDVSGLLFWDNATNLPKKSIESRSEQMSILSNFTDRIFRSEDIQEEIQKAENTKLSEADSMSLKLMKSIIVKENAIDPDLKSLLIKKKLTCEHLWREARSKNDSSIIEKDFNDLLDLVHEEASQLAMATNLSPYDSLISKYDMDYDSSKIDQVFLVIEKEIIPKYLDIKKIKSPHVYKSNISDSEILKMIKVKLKQLNFDFDRGRIDQSHHPFCGGATNDVRITTRFEDNILESLSALFHETGHGVYEQNRPNEYLYEPLGQSRSLSVHESQSLFFENHIFKSKVYFNIINNIFDNSKDLEKSFLEHYHTVRVNPIRVSADEFSYPIHVYIRYKIEKEIFKNKIKFKDIKNLWNENYLNYLSINLISETEGVLQDIHWYEGIFGYFPTYALGAMIASQIKFNCPLFDIFLGNPNEENINNLIIWLNTNFHQKASLYSSDEMLQNISGENLNPKYYLDHLVDRFIK